MKTDSRLAARLAALASLGAATIHFAVVPAHWQEWAPAGLFFLLIALSQLIWAFAVLAMTTAPILAAGIILNAGAVALWAVSRTAGAPFGPHAGEPELAQAADLCATLLQIYVVMGAGWVVYRGRRGQSISAFGNAAVLFGAAAVVALASTVGVASGLRHGHHGPEGVEPDHHEASVGHSTRPHDHAPKPRESPQVVEPLATPLAPAPALAPMPDIEPVPDSHSDHDHDH